MPGPRRLVVAVSALALGAAPLMATTTAPAAAAASPRVVWLCKPGLAENPCEIPMDTTTQRLDGPSTVWTPARPAPSRRPVDCFYVYPTVSNQPTPTATKAKDPEVVSIAKYQAARFSTRCRVFAPVYRQVTLAGIPTIALGTLAKGYADVVQAWRTYLAKYNHGRGVVLIGHSQGSMMLRELIRQQVDPKPAVRRKLVGAFLLGGNVTVAAGRTVGGDFKHVPLCTREGQAGCVVAYSTYAADPAPASFFGNTDTDALSGPSFGFRSGPGYEVACTDPGVLSGDHRIFGVTVPSEPFAPGPIRAGIIYSTDGDVPTARTTWVTAPDRYQGSCKTINGAHVFRYDPVGASRRPNEYPPGWGTHLFDVNLGLDKLLRIVRLQSATWTARH